MIMHDMPTVTADYVHCSMVKVPPWQCSRSAPAPPQGSPGSSGWLSAPRGEAGPLDAQPLPRVF